LKSTGMHSLAAPVTAAYVSMVTARTYHR
jgi:hypothetical protein